MLLGNSADEIGLFYQVVHPLFSEHAEFHIRGEHFIKGVETLVEDFYLQIK